MKRTTYEKLRTAEISFPLGGIGTGSIGLGGNGRLIDWEVFGHASKGSINGPSHIAVKAVKDGKLVDARVLNGDMYRGLTGHYGGNFGMGLSNSTMAGFPHFKDCVFRGEYPLAEIDFADEAFPAKAKLTAFNPFLPHNEKDSSIPAAFFEVTLVNTSADTLDYSVAMSVRNPWKESKNAFVCVNGDKNEPIFSGLHMTQPECGTDSPEYGDFTLATDGAPLSYQESWYRGKWFDHLETYWRNFTEMADFENRHFDTLSPAGDVGTLCVKKTLAPGETMKVRFVLSWNVPYRTSKSWGENVKLRNYYTYLFEDSKASAAYALENWERLYAATKLWHDELFASTLPEEVLDAVSATSSVLKTETCLRIGEKGDFYGWEGLNQTTGSCPGTCTHVWNYAYAMPFLFPRLERNIRENDYAYNQDENGRMSFRTVVPFGAGIGSFRACADGQFGGVMKVWREWKLSGDDEWLKKLWDGVKKSVVYAWSEANADRWDRDRDGVLEGRQHHTLDMELFGPSSWLEGFYLGALKAAAEMAEVCGDGEFAKECEALFEKGKAWSDENLFNGRYFMQKVDLTDKAMVESYNGENGRDLFGSDVVNAYWNDEAGQIKYQIGDGCLLDQLLAQWHADIIGLGELFDGEKVDIALDNMMKFNFKPDMRGHYNTFRIFALNDESGAVICDYPEGSVKPAIPIPYAQEAMHGFEYAFAGLLMSRGRVEDGLKVVRGVRDRYDGEKRNPWNEIECGSNYARSMASFAFLPILSGMTFDLTRGALGFKPKVKADNFRCVWSAGGTWGNVKLSRAAASLTVLDAPLRLRELSLPLEAVTGVTVDGKAVAFTFADGKLTFDGGVTIAENLTVR